MCPDLSARVLLATMTSQRALLWNPPAASSALPLSLVHLVPLRLRVVIDECLQVVHAAPFQEIVERDDAVAIEVEVLEHSDDDVAHHILPARHVALVLAATHQVLADELLEHRLRDLATLTRVDRAEGGTAAHPPATVRVQHRRHHAWQCHLGLVVQVAQRLVGRQRVWPQLGELVHVRVEILAVREAGQVRLDLAEELARREAETRHVVDALRLIQLRLGRSLQCNQTTHEVVHEHHWQLDVQRDRVLEFLTSRRGEQRIKRVLGGTVAPNGLRVQHPRQNCDARVAAIAASKLVEKLTARTLLQAIVTAGVLRRVFDEPACGNVLSW
mmetsp:Transcript_23859/g.48489  ORF Transcript_23859/g.48489 Transcript_23859/m.48489 type:complete len:329 (+) Transcript_23859:141-1127(+)